MKHRGSSTGPPSASFLSLNFAASNSTAVHRPMLIQLLDHTEILQYLYNKVPIQATWQDSRLY